jgi:hypothetical protein
MCNKLLFLLMVSSATAAAQTLDVRVMTLLAGQADPRDGQLHTVVPVYQTVAATARDLPNPLVDDLTLVLSAWGEVALGDPRDTPLAGDVQLGYAEGKLARRHVTLRLGRQIVAGGAARALPLDGLVVGATGPYGLGATAYGGVPVAPRFAAGRGDAAWGGRVFFRPRFGFEVGLSYAGILGEGRIGREDLGADARWTPLASLALTGGALYSLREQRLAQADAMAIWTPIPALEIDADYRRVAPDLFLPLNSVFAVFSEETRDELGGAVALRLLRRIDLRGNYHALWLPEGAGHRAGVRGTLRVGATGQAMVGAEARLLQLPARGYWQARLFALQRLPRGLVLTLDLDAYRLDPPINGQTLSLTAAASAGWSFSPGWHVVVAGFADSTPFVERRFEGMVKLVYEREVRR